MSGSSSGGTLRTTGSAEGIERDIEPPNTDGAEDEAVADELPGIDTRIVVVDQDGAAATLTQFETVIFVLEVTGIETTGTFQVRSNSEYDNGDQVATNNQIARHEPGEVLDGVFSRVMQSAILDEVGVHAFSFEGFVLLDDTEQRATFSDKLEFIIEEA